MSASQKFLSVHGSRQSTSREVQVCLLCLAVCGCFLERDDTTGSVRQVIAAQLGLPYDSVKPDSTMIELQCDDLDVVELIMVLEEAFSVKISDAEFESLSDGNDWHEISILDLANLVRSKRRF